MVRLPLRAPAGISLVKLPSGPTYESGHKNLLNSITCRGKLVSIAAWHCHRTANA